MNFACHVVPKLHAFICPAGGTHTVLIKLVVHHGLIALRVIGWIA
jgi:hypothetical protein